MAYDKLFNPRTSQPALLPKPFPGKFPTRIMVTSTDKKYPFKYVGKPVQKVADDFRRLVLSAKPFSWGRVEFWEFDQQGYVHYRTNDTFDKSQISRYYFPIPQTFYEESRNILLYVFLNRKLVKIGKRRIYVIPELFNPETCPAYVEMVRQAAKDNMRYMLPRGWDRAPVPGVASAYESVIMNAQQWTARPQSPPTPPTQPVLDLPPAWPADPAALMPAWTDAQVARAWGGGVTTNGAANWLQGLQGAANVANAVPPPQPTHRVVFRDFAVPALEPLDYIDEP